MDSYHANQDKGIYTPAKKDVNIFSQNEKYPGNFQHSQQVEPTHGKKIKKLEDEVAPPTVQPRRAIVLISENRSKRVFPLYGDNEVGIHSKFQNRVHSTHNDDDRLTTSTQLGLAISQTCNDLYERVAPNYKE